MKDRTGSIEQIASGKWRVRMRLPGVGRKTVGTFDSREMAESCLAQALDVVRNAAPDEGVTLLAYGEKVLTARELGKKIRDPESDRGRWDLHIASDPIAKIAVRSIRDTHIEDWLERLEAKGTLAWSTRNNCLNVLRVIFRIAKKRRLCSVNPCIGVRIERPPVTEDAWTFLTLEEQDAVIASARTPLDALVEFAIGAGFRAGELISLRLDDVHLEGRDPYATVRYGGAPTAQYPQGQPPKRGKIRHVPLFGRSLRALHRWLAALPTYCPKNPYGLAFPAPRGGYRNEAHVIKWAAWKKLLADAGITRDFRWHDLRHTCASSLVSGWWGRYWQLAEVRDMLGHASITTTERYAHLADTALKRAARETAPDSVHTGPHSKATDLEKPSDIAGATLGNRTRDLRFTKPTESTEKSQTYSVGGPMVDRDGPRAAFPIDEAAGNLLRLRLSALEAARALRVQS